MTWNIGDGPSPIYIASMSSAQIESLEKINTKMHLM